MYKTLLCLGTSEQYGIGICEQIKLFRDTGFEGYFVNWSPETDISAIRSYGDSLGMIFQSIHAPFGRAYDMWCEGEESEHAVSELLDCLDDCAENDVPVMVCHAIIGFDKHEPNEVGINNYRRIVERARELGVKIAFENTEGEEYLAALMNAFSDYENVGFCWDTGHEMCYNHSRDMMSLYGDRIICTHLNDNLGIKRYDGETIWTDDLHLLPFDGIGDWRDIVGRLNRYGYDGILTFELNKLGKPDRHENDIYADMSIERYVAQAYCRACKVATLKQAEKR